MTAQTSSFTPHPVPDGRMTIGDKPYMSDAKGGFTPIEMIKPQELLEDETVRKIMGYALALNDQVRRFKGHVFDDLGSFDALLAQEYGLARGGPKGNRTYRTYDNLMQIEVRVADLIDFGPELQIAKALIDECLNEWASDSRAEIRAVITKAFNTEKEGKVNRTEIFMLKRLKIDEERWKAAMAALDAAIRITGSKTYIRIQTRDSIDAPWSSVTIDLAKA